MKSRMRPPENVSGPPSGKPTTAMRAPALRLAYAAPGARQLARDGRDAHVDERADLRRRHAERVPVPGRDLDAVGAGEHVAVRDQRVPVEREARAGGDADAVDVADAHDQLLGLPAQALRDQRRHGPRRGDDDLRLTLCTGGGCVSDSSGGFAARPAQPLSAHASTRPAAALRTVQVRVELVSAFAHEVEAAV